MSVQDFVPVHVEIFPRMRENEGITKVLRIHPLGSMIVCIKFLANLSNSY